MNPAQAYLLNIFARTMVVNAGRGFGKGLVHASWFIKMIQRMPGCTLAFVTPTIKRAKTNTLPSITTHWERFGFHRNQSWVIGRKPPVSLGFAKPNFEVNDYENIISFYNGSQIIIVSQDRPGTSNSLSLDGVDVDEGRYVDYKQLKDETLPANRANESLYGKHSCHHAMLVMSDMSSTSQGNWMFNYKDKMNPKHIEAIEACITLIWKLRVDIEMAKQRGEQPKEYLYRELRKRNKQMEMIRAQSVLYKEYSSIENIQVLGRGFIERMKRDLPPLTFRTSILGIRSKMSSSNFYATMKLSHRYRCPSNFHNLDAAEYDFEKLTKMGCLADGDVNTFEHLCIGMDYNANINWLVVGQHSGRYARVVKSFYVKFERKLPELISDFCDYFEGHINKTVVFYYDSTALGSNYAVNDIDFKRVIIDELEKRGWIVLDVYLGNPMQHSEKHMLLNAMFQGQRNLIPMINEDNNEDLLIALENTGVYNGHKDKRGEKEEETENSPLENRTDATDAFDTLMIGMERFPQLEASAISLGSMG